MSPAAQPFRARVAEAVHADLAHDEALLGATRLSTPYTRTRTDESGKERNNLLDMALLQRSLALVRQPPKQVPGFPIDWDMIAVLTRHRIVLWKPLRTGDQPSSLIGAVPLSDLDDVELATVPVRGGRSLAVKFVLKHGPRVMLDVVAGFREDTEQFVAEAQRLIIIRRRR